MGALGDGDAAESDGDALTDAAESALEVDEADPDAEDEDEVVAVADDRVALGVAVGVELVELVELVEGAEVVLGADEVDGAAVLVDGLGELGAEADEEPADGVASGWVESDVVVVGAAGIVVRVPSAVALDPCVPVNDAGDVSDAIELIDVLGAAADDVFPAEAAVVVVLAAVVCCADGDVDEGVTGAEDEVTGTEMAEACAGWLEPVAPKLIAAAAAAMPTTPTELSSTPFAGCSSLKPGWRRVLRKTPGREARGLRGFTRACRAPVLLLSRIGFPSPSAERKTPP